MFRWHRGDSKPQQSVTEIATWRKETNWEMGNGKWEMIAWTEYDYTVKLPCELE